MNSIGKIAFDFSGENELFFRSLFGHWDSFFTNAAEKTADRLLMRFDDTSFLLELDTLELELGSIPEENFVQRFAVLFEEKLEEALLQHLYGTGNGLIKSVSTQQKLSELLCRFLLHGSLPWYLEARYKDIDFLFLEVIRSEARELKRFLQTYGHYSSLRQRLVYQLGDRALEEGVRMLAPGESSFIISYVNFLRSTYKRLERPDVRESDHRNAVWKVVYAYLLNNRSSFFNKKNFLRQTIRQLAGHHNISYTALLSIVTAGVASYMSAVAAPQELLLLLDALKKEAAEQPFHGSVADITKMYRAFIRKVKQNGDLQWTDNHRNELSAMLAKEDTCRRFLQLLHETEIVGLVKVIISHEAAFVVSYATSLDRQKEKGMLQGKAGGEFRLVKWQIIFPVLLANNGAGFNRKHFVLRVLAKVAAHYNLEVWQVLAYLNDAPGKFSFDTQLQSIFRELYADITEKAHPTAPPITPHRRSILHAIATQQELSTLEIRQWKSLLASAGLRKKLLDTLREEEHRILIHMLFPKESPFIVAYAKAVDAPYKKGIFQGGTSGTFTQLKWQFIHAVLFEGREQVFNKKHFVTAVLSRIAAHHNLKTETLLVYLCEEIEKAHFAFPFDLVKVLQELYSEQLKNQHKSTTAVSEATQKHAAAEQAKQRLLRHFGAAAELAFLIAQLATEHEFVRYIEQVLHTEALLCRFLKETFGFTPDRKRLLELLVFLSRAPQHLSRADIMAKTVVLLLRQLPAEEQLDRFEQELQRLARHYTLLRESLAVTSGPAEPKQDGRDETIPEPDDVRIPFIQNAGLVLLAPFLPRLFTMHSLTAAGTFIDREAQVRAMFLMQYAVFGEGEFPEYEMQFNKLLTGFKTGVPIPRSVELTAKEKETVKDMLNAAIQHWKKVKSVEGLQEGFLQREGKLEEREDVYQLTVAGKAYDMLLESIPWNFKTVKFSWMEKAIHVKWR